MIPVDIALLKASIGEFMGGYQTYTTNSLGNKSETRVHIQKALEIQDKWLKEKIKSLPKQS